MSILLSRTNFGVKNLSILSKVWTAFLLLFGQNFVKRCPYLAKYGHLFTKLVARFGDHNTKPTKRSQKERKTLIFVIFHCASGIWSPKNWIDHWKIHNFLRALKIAHLLRRSSWKPLKKRKLIVSLARVYSRLLRKSYVSPASSDLPLWQD